jgi:hypothetical protein
MEADSDTRNFGLDIVDTYCYHAAKRILKHLLYRYSRFEKQNLMIDE